MAEENVPIRRYTPERGLDLTSSDLRRPPSFASSGKNFDWDDSGDLIKRQGHQQISEPLANTEDIFKWSGVGLSQADKAEVLLLRTTPAKLVFGEVVITYPAGDHTYKMFYDPGTAQYRAQITENVAPSTLMDFALGDGTGGDPDITALRAAIDAVAGFSTAVNGTVIGGDFGAWTEAVTLTRTSAGTAYFRTFQVDTVPSPGAFMLDVTSPATPSSALVNDVLYMTFGSGPIGKYDGANFYKAGLPKPPKPGIADKGSGPGTGAGWTRYQYQYFHIDNAGNIVEGQLSDTVDYENTTAFSVNITLDYLTTDYDIGGFRYTDGEPTYTYEAGDTIVLVNLDATELATLAVGEKVLWTIASNWVPTFKRINDDLERAANGNVETIQTGVITGKPSATSVSIKVDKDGKILDNCIVGKMYTAIWRSGPAQVAQEDLSSTPMILLDEVSMAGFTATEVLADAVEHTTTQNDRQSQPFQGDIPPDFGSPPPEGRLLANYRNQLIVSGVPDEPDIVHFSVSGRPDVFTEAVNSFRVGNGQNGDDITGLGSAEDYLMVLKDKSIYRVTGDLGGAFAVDRISSTVGCVSGMSVREMSVGLLGFLSHEGPWMIVRGQQVVPMGATPDGRDSRLKKFFRDILKNPDAGNGSLGNYNLNLSRGFVWESENKYGIRLSKSGDVDLKTFIYDTSTDGWTDWDNDMKGFLAVASPRLETPTFSQDSSDWVFFLDGTNVAKLHKKNVRDEDYNDNGAAISWSYGTHWETGGAPSQLKKFLRANIFSLPQQTFTLTLKQEINWDETSEKSEITYSFVGTADPSVKGKFRHQRARSQKIIFENAVINQRVTMSGYELEVVPPYGVKLKE